MLRSSDGAAITIAALPIALCRADFALTRSSLLTILDGRQLCGLAPIALGAAPHLVVSSHRNRAALSWPGLEDHLAFVGGAPFERGLVGGPLAFLVPTVPVFMRSLIEGESAVFGKGRCRYEYAQYSGEHQGATHGGLSTTVGVTDDLGAVSFGFQIDRSQHTSGPPKTKKKADDPFFKDRPPSLPQSPRNASAPATLACSEDRSL